MALKVDYDRKMLLDGTIVLNILNYLKSRDSIVGLSGTITSIFGVQDTWKSNK
ncbi:hypothetical protein RI543_002277 [Arxiozyma heterogenica]|uniref:Uncharacterized protein n=1 Tax=Arxiozyma heterogenica TaxID=278026 RepID=A0AAN7WRF2_9SACH|nr:hypothetical protein RI543_002277 [Kazachstania heterogenica]